MRQTPEGSCRSALSDKKVVSPCVAIHWFAAIHDIYTACIAGPCYIGGVEMKMEKSACATGRALKTLPHATGKATKTMIC